MAGVVAGEESPPPMVAHTFAAGSGQVTGEPCSARVHMADGDLGSSQLDGEFEVAVVGDDDSAVDVTLEDVGE